MAWAYEVGLWSLCSMSWPAAKVTVVTDVSLDLDVTEVVFCDITK